MVATGPEPRFTSISVLYSASERSQKEKYLRYDGIGQEFVYIGYYYSLPTMEQKKFVDHASSESDNIKQVEEQKRKNTPERTQCM